MNNVRTRFAPSPTGFMHIGGVRTALFCYLIAKKNKGAFILRIEDTDQKRYVDGSLEVIYDTLKDLGLNWDEGPDIGGPYAPYIQSERKGNYLQYAKRLVDEEKAYYCFCNEARLDDLKTKAKATKVAYKYDGYCKNLSKQEVKDRKDNNEEGVIRFKIPDKGTTIFEDKVYGKITVNNEELEDLILIKSDGMPTYNFANIIDDHEMAITHIVRGNEFISSTPKYILIYQAFGWDIPEFIHLPIIKKTKDSNKKLGKRDGAATVDRLKDKGYLKEALINMLALTGWSPGSEQEIFSLEELVNIFEIGRIGKGNAIFDVEKLNWLNNHYIRQLTIDQLYDFLFPYLNNNYDLTDKKEHWLKELMAIYQEQLDYGAQIIEITALFFKEDIEIDEAGSSCIENMNSNEVISSFKAEIESINDWTTENIIEAINNTKKETGIKGKELFMPIRIKVTGQMHGPELPKTIHLLGQEIVLKRLS